GLEGADLHRRLRHVVEEIVERALGQEPQHEHPAEYDGEQDQHQGHAPAGGRRTPGGLRLAVTHRDSIASGRSGTASRPAGPGGVRWRVLRRQGLQCGGAGARTGRKGRFWTWSGCLCNDRGSGRRLGHNRPPPVSACRMPMSAPASPRRILFASLIGTMIEFFDFYIYATAAVLVFPKLFFPASEPTAATLQSLATFALAFLARPLGSAVFGHYGDRIGRKATLVAALLTMGISTVLIGLLPTYAQVGVLAPALLALCRFGQ